MSSLKTYQEDLLLSSRAQRLDDIAMAITGDVCRLRNQDESAPSGAFKRYVRDVFNWWSLKGCYDAEAQTLTYIVGPANPTPRVGDELFADAQSIQQLAAARVGAICAAPQVDVQVSVIAAEIGTAMREVVRVHLDQPYKAKLPTLG